MPPSIPEMNMSQNSVVLHTKTPEEAAFLTIFLNSEINRIQVRGAYSITKQKFLNQGKIASLKVMVYDTKYTNLMRQYITEFNAYYESVSRIHQIIDTFNSDYQLPFSDTAQYGFVVNPASLSKTMLTPNFYRDDVRETINHVISNVKTTELDTEGVKKGDEIGSAFYLDCGIPFIKTSDIMNGFFFIALI